MKSDTPIQLILTIEEANWFLGMIDLSLKSQGIQVLAQAAMLKGKLEAAANKAAEEVKPA